MEWRPSCIYILYIYCVELFRIYYAIANWIDTEFLARISFNKRTTTTKQRERERERVSMIETTVQMSVHQMSTTVQTTLENHIARQLAKRPYSEPSNKIGARPSQSLIDPPTGSSPDNHQTTTNLVIQA